MAIWPNAAPQDGQGTSCAHQPQGAPGTRRQRAATALRVLGARLGKQAVGIGDASWRLRPPLEQGAPPAGPSRPATTTMTAATTPKKKIATNAAAADAEQEARFRADRHPDDGLKTAASQRLSPAEMDIAARRARRQMQEIGQDESIRPP